METASEYVTFTMTKNVAEKTTIAISPLEYLEVQQDAAKTALTEANATIASQKSAMAAMELKNRQQSIKLREAVETEKQNAILQKTWTEANQYIQGMHEALEDVFAPLIPGQLSGAMLALYHAWKKTAPPVVSVTPLKPIITKTALSNVAGACITLGLKAPSPTVDAAARELMKLISDMGFNTVRFFRNKDEIRDDLKRNPEDPRNLYAAAKKLGLTVVADTINRAAELYSDTELSQYLAGLKSLGAAALVFDDANQYADEKKDDGTLKYPPNTLKDMVGRVRRYTDLPLIASVRANARVQDYKPLFEWVEFQTFGKLTELDDFLRLPADCFVFDGQATIGNDYLRGAHDEILKDNPAAFFYYTSLDEDTDWRNMDDKTALIEKTVKAWNAARIVKA